MEREMALILILSVFFIIWFLVKQELDKRQGHITYVETQNHTQAAELAKSYEEISSLKDQLYGDQDEESDEEDEAEEELKYNPDEELPDD